MIVQRCDFAIGDLIDHRYQVIKSLGEGSFGKVYAVSDFNGQQYALKLLKLWEVPSSIRSSLVDRFDMEFETGRINSEYLVHSLAHGMVEGNPYIVMEFCPYGDLISYMSQQNVNLSVVASHVLYGLKALHSSGKVHRDLKPENVLVKSNGIFALTDFGISGDRNKRMTERNILGKPKQIFGTYAYMPPEQLNPEREATVLPTTDIFSFGVMMFQLITGKLPYGSLKSEKDVVPYIKRGKQGEWDRATLFQIPDGRKWGPMIEGCLLPDFHDRLQNVDAVLSLVPEREFIKEQSHKTPKDFQTHIVNGLQLHIMQGEEYGRIYKLDDMLTGNCSILRMGRSDYGISNDIAIVEEMSSYISRRHCTLELDYNLGTWVIRDGQWVSNTGSASWHRSTNGTFVNSEEVTERGMAFYPGDIISVGDTKLRVEAY